MVSERTSDAKLEAIDLERLGPSDHRVELSIKGELSRFTAKGAMPSHSPSSSVPQ